MTSYDHIRVNAPRSISTSKLSILELGLVLAWVTSRETPVSYVLLPLPLFFFLFFLLTSPPLSPSLPPGATSAAPGLEARRELGTKKRECQCAVREGNVLFFFVG